MSLWNPYAFNVFGDPLPPAAPPALRVYGGEATAKQLSSAQSAFAVFSEGMRMSYVPNPTELGRLPDGSIYRITVVGNTATMELWVNASAAAAVDINVLSGIIFFGRKQVLVNGGKSDAPSGDWRLVDVSKVAYDSARDPAMRPAEYNGNVFLTGSRSAPGGNLYMLESSNGIYIIRYKNPTAFIGSEPGQLVGLTEGGRILKLQQSGGKLQILASQPVNFKTLFKKFGSPPQGSPPGVSFYPREVLSEPGDDVRLGEVAVSKSGAKIAFVRTALSNPYSAADIVDGKATLPIANRMYVIAREVPVAGSPAGIRNALIADRETFLFYKTGELTLNESMRSGEVFGPPTVVKALPPSTVTPSGKFYVSSVPGGIRLYYSGVGFQISGVEYPRLKMLSASNFKVVDAHRITYSATYGAGGPVRRTVAHEEEQHAFSSIGYAGFDSPAVIVEANTIRYKEVAEGTVSISCPDGGGEYDPTTSSGPAAGGFAFGPGQGGGPTTLRTSSIGATITLDSLTELDLGSGRKLIGSKSTYSEFSTHVVVKNNTNSWLNDYDSTDQSTSYTLEKEHRGVLLWDPSLDILCYTELLTSVAGESSGHLSRTYESSSVSFTDYSHTAGPTLPAAPQPYLVIECRGRTIRLAIPFFPPDATESAKKAALWTMFPNTGVCPGVPALSNNVGSQDIDLGTSLGFYYLDVNLNAQHSLTVVSMTAPNPGETVLESELGFRGMSPSFDFRVPELRYKKTPDTGGAYMTISLSDGKILSERYVIDSGGIRNADDVVPNLPPKNETIRDWGIF